MLLLMIPLSIQNAVAQPSEQADATLLADDSAVFWVDWREEDDAIAGYCEGILKTGSLRGEVVDIDDEPGFEIHISYRDRRLKVPLVVGPEDRHLTVLTLNQVLAPEYEIRALAASRGSDSVAFAPLALQDWAALEARFGPRMDEHFVKLRQRPNVFTEPW